MSADKLLQPRSSAVEEPVRSEHRADQPLALRDKDLMALLGIGHSAFYRRKRRGDFTFLELRNLPADTNTLYSRHLVEKWLRGELSVPGESRRFFTSVAKLARTEPRRVGRPRKGNQAVAVVAHRGVSVGRSAEAAKQHGAVRNCREADTKERRA